jgi:hypothetical protein
MTVFVQWMWAYVTNQPGSRLIVKHRPASSARPAAGEQRLRA